MCLNDQMPRTCFGPQLEMDILRSARKHFKHDEEVLANVFKEGTEIAINQIWFVKSLDSPLHSACRLKIPNQEAGGFKKMWKHNNAARLLAHCASARVNQMVLKEILIQQYLSKYDFVPRIISLKVSCSGSLTIPIYEVLIEMPLLQTTLMAFLNSNPASEDMHAMFSQVISAMSTLNNAGFLHNDMKPDNIMSTEVEMFEFNDAFNMNTIRCTRKWCIIDFGLCTSSNGLGDDLFFFAWWVYHRAHDILDRYKLLPCFQWVLYVPKTEIPLHMHEHIQCESTKTHINFAAPNPHPETKNAWLQNYGVTKETLYSLAQQKRSSNEHMNFLQSIEDALR